MLDAYLTRADGVEWDELEDRAVIAIPKRYGAIERFVARWFPGPETVFVTFDALGTEAWRLADGSRRVRDVAEALRARFGAGAEPAEARAAAFASGLVARGYAKIFEAPRAARDDARGFTAARGYRRVACPRCAREQPFRGRAGARFVCPRCGRVTKAL